MWRWKKWYFAKVIYLFMTIHLLVVLVLFIGVGMSLLHQQQPRSRSCTIASNAGCTARYIGTFLLNSCIQYLYLYLMEAAPKKISQKGIRGILGAFEPNNLCPNPLYVWCFAFWRTSSKTSMSIFFFKKHCQNIASFRRKHDVLHDGFKC